MKVAILDLPLIWARGGPPFTFFTSTPRHFRAFLSELLDWSVAIMEVKKQAEVPWREANG